MTNKSAGVLDKFGHCKTCGVHESELRRLDRLLVGKQIAVVNRHIGCEHILVYRSVGLWTTTIEPPVKIDKKIKPDPKVWIASARP